MKKIIPSKTRGLSPFIILISIPLLVMSYNNSFFISKDKDKKIKVTVVPVNKDNIVRKVKGRGKILSSRKEEIRIKNLLKVEKMWVKEGDIVQKNQELASLRDNEGMMENLERIKEKQETEKEIALLNYEKLTTGRDQLLKEEESLILKSPFKGKVMGINRDESSKEPLLIISDMDNLEVVARIDTYDIALVKKGQIIDVFLEEYSEGLKGEVREIGMEVVRAESYGQGNPNLVEVKATLHGAVPERLKLGTEVEVKIIVDEQKDVLVVPQEAVLEEEGKMFVYIVKGVMAIKKEVEVGINDSEKIEIKKGLAIGEKVITRGNIDLKGGESISWEQS